MKAKSLKGKSIEEIKFELTKSLKDDFKPTLDNNDLHNLTTCCVDFKEK